MPSKPPPIISYHVHITYTLFNPPVVERALALREKTVRTPSALESGTRRETHHTYATHTYTQREAFKDFLGPDCDGRYDYGYLCLIADHDLANTTLIGGPFVSGEWSIFIPVGYYSLVVPWMLQNRGEFSMILHPNTGFEYEDHSIWAMWAGEPWPLDMTIFEQGVQTNEFGHYRGDPDNPACLPYGAVCGDTLFGPGPAALCCYSLACSVAESFAAGNHTLYRCL